jgi:hypothetical protein
MADETAVEVEVEVTPEGSEVGERAQVAPDGTRYTAADVEIEVEEPKKPEKPKAAVVKTDDGLEKLKTQLAEEKKRGDEEREGRLAAENRAREAAESEAREKNKSQATELDLVKGAITSLTQANDALEEKYATALAAQDYAAASKAQREMSANEAKLVDLNRGKTNMESAPKAIPRAALDPVDTFARNIQANGYPKSADWVRQHPEYVRDPAKNRKLMAAHELAMADGNAADSPGYFASIEETLRIAAPQLAVDDPSTEAARLSAARPSRQAAPPSAPVSRSGNGTGGANRQIITLSREQIEAAKLMDMTPEDYAKQVIALKAEGRMN